ncbi:DUF488 domain-containing protein [Pragia fontium]|uniref:Uncharacterized conserved protein YeaO, DUF488 family n=1 Tax=Pragia fontium DSM 5563 = ATCC 49100 TaxID=1122977 RepID=A0AAJ5BG54_9GAMM|nr:DUF488 family protein [Pragia fontium]SFC17766.1 Uncharacterized conserved protein YeaO, DUF488 family [Pragia fontium DSM 5563 = ATCC 49100]VEJ53328.1 Uncharacterized conserved protein [Pragia fontium]
MANIQLVRVYDMTTPVAENSFLTDRLWPRGISKAKLVDVTWLKDVAPSNDLRKRFHADTTRWDDFRRDYYAELNAGNAWLPLLALLRQGKNITLMFGSKNIEHNQGVVLRDFLLEKFNGLDESVHYSGE